MPCSWPWVGLLCCCSTAGVQGQQGQHSVERDALRIAAFNIKVLGQKKMNNEIVVNILVKIIIQYDVILIQEIRDSKGTAIKKLLAQVNKRKNKYAMVISERLGRTRSKEQYAFLYRTDRAIDVVGTYQYPDDQDLFEREPYAVRVRVPWLEIPEFILVAIHVDPDTAVDEINALVPVHNIIEKMWKVGNILIMGDFNAGGRYVGKSKLANLDLRKDGFYWLIPDDADTTVATGNYAYDRFVLSGEDFYKSVIPESVTVFRFDDAYGLSLDETNAVSDHFPIELSLRPGQHYIQEDEIVTSGCGFMDSIRNMFRRFRNRHEL